MSYSQVRRPPPSNIVPLVVPGTFFHFTSGIRAGPERQSGDKLGNLEDEATARAKRCVGEYEESAQQEKNMRLVKRRIRSCAGARAYVNVCLLGCYDSALPGLSTRKGIIAHCCVTNISHIGF